jgi:hypothetical protein
MGFFSSKSSTPKPPKQPKRPKSPKPKGYVAQVVKQRCDSDPKFKAEYHRNVQLQKQYEEERQARCMESIENRKREASQHRKRALAPTQQIARSDSSQHRLLNPIQRQDSGRRESQNERKHREQPGVWQVD